MEKVSKLRVPQSTQKHISSQQAVNRHKSPAQSDPGSTEKLHNLFMSSFKAYCKEYNNSLPKKKHWREEQ